MPDQYYTVGRLGDQWEYTIRYPDNTTGATTYNTSDIDTVWQSWSTSASSTTISYEIVDRAWQTWSQTAYRYERTGYDYYRRFGDGIRPGQQSPNVAAANERARDLLRTLLTDEQWADYENEGWFCVTAPSGRRYRISRGRAGNVYSVDENGEWLARLCCHPRECVPDEDTMAAQALMLQTDEDGFLALANVHRRNDTMAA